MKVLCLDVCLCLPKQKLYALGRPLFYFTLQFSKFQSIFQQQHYSLSCLVFYHLVLPWMLHRKWVKLALSGFGTHYKLVSHHMLRYVVLHCRMKINAWCLKTVLCCHVAPWFTTEKLCNLLVKKKKIWEWERRRLQSAKTRPYRPCSLTDNPSATVQPETRYCDCTGGHWCRIGSMAWPIKSHHSQYLI